MRKKALEQVFICRESLPSHSESALRFISAAHCFGPFTAGRTAAAGVKRSSPGPDHAAAEDSEPRSKLIEKPLRFNE